MRSAFSTALVFVGVLVVGAVGLKVSHPDRSMKELVTGGEADPDWMADSVMVTPFDPAENCLAVPRQMVDYLESHLVPAGQVTLRHPRAYRPGNFVRPYYISAELDGEGLEGDGQVATWSATSLTPGDGTTVKAEEDLAAAWSDLADGRRTDDWDRSMFEGHLFVSDECVRAEERG